MNEKLTDNLSPEDMEKRDQAADFFESVGKRMRHCKTYQQIEELLDKSEEESEATGNDLFSKVEEMAMKEAYHNFMTSGTNSAPTHSEGEE